VIALIRQKSWGGFGRPLLLATTAVALTSPATAAGFTVTGDDAAVIGQIAQNTGVAELTYSDILNEPEIGVTRPDGRSWFTIKFLGCSNGVACEALSLIADYGRLDDMTPEKLNEFNAEYFYARAYVDGQRSVVLQEEVQLTHGVNSDWLQVAFNTFGQLVDRFEDWSSEITTAGMIERLRRK
jgi:hypothetical protein